jgi:membrane-associated phospholipid phosphatase
MLTQRARMLWSHNPTPDASSVDVFDYFISFPSLHIALPLIAIWFLHGYKWIARVYLSIYVLLLIPAIVFLEWHYVIDIAGGFVIALLAIWVSHLLSSPIPADAPALAC